MKLRTVRDFQNLQRSAHQEWFRIVKNQTATVPTTDVHIFDEIGWFGVSAQDFIKELQGIEGHIDLHLNSPGGEVFDGIAIYNALAQRGDVRVVVDSLAASIASVIAMAGNPIVMLKRSQMMIHDGFGLAMGNAADMREMADLLDEQSDNIAGIYSDRTGKPSSYWRDQMKNETWYTAEKARDAGLADEVLDPHAKTNKAPVERIRNAAVDESAWDASKAWHNGAESDDPASFYDGICAGKKAGDPATQAAHALPHHYHPSDPPNADGVRNALARIDQTEGLTNEEDAEQHLQDHMKVINPDYKPTEDEPSNRATSQFAAMVRALQEVR
jgi:ATP-dependent Clp endopeptidase proteolytic subunit ClpP